MVRALANNPEVLLMDEPFASVDAQTRMTLQEELTRIWQERRPTVIFITHDVAEAVFLANRVVVLSKGRVLDEVVDHLRTMRDAVFTAAEERRPRDAREAEERGRLLLLDAVTNGASWEEIVELTERAPNERAGLL